MKKYKNNKLKVRNIYTLPGTRFMNSENSNMDQVAFKDKDRLVHFDNSLHPSLAKKSSKSEDRVQVSDQKQE